MGWDNDSPVNIGFFDRLEADNFPRDSDSDIVSGIKNNLSRILNTRVGESQSCPELGLFDFNDASADSVDLCRKMQQSVKHCIENFEHRISDLKVTVLYEESTPMLLKFEIQGRIKSDSLENLLRIELILDSNRRYRVI